MQDTTWKFIQDSHAIDFYSLWKTGTKSAFVKNKKTKTEFVLERTNPEIKYIVDFDVISH